MMKIFLSVIEDIFWIKVEALFVPLTSSQGFRSDRMFLPLKVRIGKISLPANIVSFEAICLIRYQIIPISSVNVLFPILLGSNPTIFTFLSVR